MNGRRHGLWLALAWTILHMPGAWGATYENTGSMTLPFVAPAPGDTIINRETGAIDIAADGRFGMEAFLPSSALNFGVIRANGRNSGGMVGTSSAVVTNRGSITAGGNDSVGMLGTYSAVLTNMGSITAGGVYVFGMEVRNNAVATNAGTITMTGGLATYGMVARDFASMTNTGLISTAATGGVGMIGFDSGVLANAGTIAASGNNSPGMWANSSDELINTGRIMTSGDDCGGMLGIDSVVLTNTGTIATSGNDSPGMYGRDSTVLTNAGTIHVTAADVAAMAAYDNSEARILTGSQFTGNRSVFIDDTSRLFVDAADDQAFQLLGAGTVFKRNAGVWSVEGASTAGSLALESGRLILSPGATLALDAFQQSPGARLVFPLVSGAAGRLTAATADFGGRAVLVDPDFGSLGRTFTIVTAPDRDGYQGVAGYNPHFALSSGWSGDDLLVRAAYAPRYDISALGTLAQRQAFYDALHAARHRTAPADTPAGADAVVRPALLASAGDMEGILAAEGRALLAGYLRPFAGHTNSKAYAGRPGFDADQLGLDMGLELQGASSLLGVHALYAETDIDYRGQAFSADDAEDQETLALGLYGSWRRGSWTLRDHALVSRTHHDYVRRAALDTTAEGDYESWMAGNALSAAYGFDFGGWRLAPEAGLIYAYLHREDFREKGAVNAVAYESLDEHFLDAELAVSAERTFTRGDADITPRARLGFLHALRDNDLTVHQTIAGGVYAVTESDDDDRLRADLGLTVGQGRLEVDLAYNGFYSAHTRSHAATLALRWAF